MNQNSPAAEAVLKEIRAELEQSEPYECGISFEAFWNAKYHADDRTFCVDAMLSEVRTMREHGQYAYGQPLTSYRKIFSIPVKCCKKILRKMLAFLFLPLVGEQTRINAQMERLSEQTLRFCSQDRNHLQTEMRREQDLTECRIEQADRILAQTAAQTAALQERLRNLREKGGLH